MGRCSAGCIPARSAVWMRFSAAPSIAPAHRCQDAGKLLQLLQQTLRLVQQGKSYLISNVEHVARFVGRRQELDAIRADFEEGKKVVFLSGFGGIGKSTLAKQYAQINYGPRALYDTIVFFRYRENIKLKRLLAQLPMSQESEGYDPRLAAMDQRTLLILDNYDVLSPGEDWEILTSLPCHLLVTTRTDFSDWAGEGQVAQRRVDILEFEDLLQLFEQNAGIQVSRSSCRFCKRSSSPSAITHCWPNCLPNSCGTPMCLWKSCGRICLTSPSRSATRRTAALGKTPSAKGWTGCSP